MLLISKSTNLLSLFSPFFPLESTMFSSTSSSDPFVFRPLEPSDFHKDYLPLLSQLTTAPAVSDALFASTFSQIAQLAPFLHVIVAEDVARSKIVASCTLLIEPKFVHGCSKVGHIEDVVVDADTRGTGLGKKIVQYVVDLAKQSGCYKVILDCSDKNSHFYEKCGFHKKELQMALYF